MSFNDSRLKMKKSLFINSSWLFGDKIVRIFLGLAISILMARLLGPEQLGKWNYAESFFGMFMIFTTMGLDSIVVRDLVKDKEQEQILLGSAIMLKFLGTIFAVGASYACLLLVRPDDSLVISINVILGAASLFQVFDVLDYRFRSQMMSKYTVLSKNFAFIISSGLKITFLLLHMSVIYVAICVHIEFLIGSLIMLLFYRQQKQSIIRWKVHFYKMKALLGNCWPIILSSSAVLVQARIDQVIIGEMLGDEAVGQYSVALRLIEVLGFIPVVISTAFAPVVTRAKLASEKQYKETLGTVYRLMFIVFLITSIPIFIISNRLVVLLYGNEFAPAGALLSLFGIRLFFTNFGVAKSLFITNENMFKYTLITSIIGAVSNILLNYLLIPILGVKGSLVATIISFTISIFLIDLCFKRARANLYVMIGSICTFWKIGRIGLKVGESHVANKTAH